jgi:hypothetical protein
LVAHRPLSALLLLAVELGLNLVDGLLGSVQLVGDVFDLLAVVLDSLAQPDDVVFNLLAVGGRFKLNEGGLLLHERTLGFLSFFFVFFLLRLMVMICHFTLALRSCVSLVARVRH